MNFLDHIDTFDENKRVALISKGSALRYDDLYRETIRLGKGLEARRFTNGRVALALPSNPSHASLALAILRIGLTTAEIPFDCSNGNGRTGHGGNQRSAEKEGKADPGFKRKGRDYFIYVGNYVCEHII